MLTPKQRSIRARIGAYALHAAHDTRETTQKAREVFSAHFLDEVDPKRELPESERLRRAEASRKAYFSLLALRSAQARGEGRATPHRPMPLDEQRAVA